MPSGKRVAFFVEIKLYVFKYLLNSSNYSPKQLSNRFRFLSLKPLKKSRI